MQFNYLMTCEWYGTISLAAVGAASIAAIVVIRDSTAHRPYLA